MLQHSPISRLATMTAFSAVAFPSSTAMQMSPVLVDLAAKAAPMASMVVCFAPYPTIRNVSEKKDVGTLPLLPYSSMIANCFLWMFYGILKNEASIWGTNMIGLVFGLYYFLEFAKYAPRESPTFPGSIRQHAKGCSAVIATALAVKFLMPVQDPAAIIGNMAVLFCIALFGSPLSTVKTVLQTKSAQSIPLPFTLATVLNCLCWVIVGVFQMNDMNVWLPNALGLSFGLAQVSLKLTFGKGKEGIPTLL